MFCRLSEMRSGEICNACVLLVKRWKKLPVGTKKNWNHVSLDHITDVTSDDLTRQTQSVLKNSLLKGRGRQRRAQSKDNFQAQEDKEHLQESSPQSDQQATERAEKKQ